ncbi:MAG: hypothetical protein M0P33_04200, partial [Massilibacteroides sp.]|nr:hypothetical protein [Massilibacteroides sp.]
YSYDYSAAGGPFVSASSSGRCYDFPFYSLGFFLEMLSLETGTTFNLLCTEIDEKSKVMFFRIYRIYY